MLFRAPERGAAALLIGTFLAAAGCAGEIPAEEAPEIESGPVPLERITRPAEDGDVHFVRLVQRGDRYSFEPAELTLPPGDVLRFVMTGSQPESVAFDPASATPEAAEFIRGRNLHLGVLLTDVGQARDVSFRDAPPGRYPFLSLPHADRGMRGVVTVQAPD
jgi:plastocyanin